jgi:hypothetical protein
MMNRFLLLVTILCLTAILAGATDAQEVSNRPADVLEGVLRVHPKFHYRYYVDGFGDGQHCALFGADEVLKQVKPGSLIRVQGELASRFFGNPKDTSSALISTWIIHMNVAKVGVLRGPLSVDRPSTPPSANGKIGLR